jgi:F0F1-type ATP synthase epsilon subunit
MHLKVAGAEELIFEADIYGFETIAIDGKIAFLDQHADYLTVLKKGEIGIIDTKGEKAKRKVTLKEDSLLFIENNKAIVFC